MNHPLLDEITSRLMQAEKILIFSHVKPDGDAFGSALGLMWLLRTQGKVADVSFADPVSVNFRFLPGQDEVDDRSVEGYDLVVAVDGSDEKRYGSHFSAFWKAKQDAPRGFKPFLLGIDHHKTNTLFADLNWVDSRYVATAQMIYDLAQHAQWPISTQAATCLATGCITDTNTFSTDHTTPEVLENVADLMRQGAPLSTIIYQAISLRTASDAALWGRILSTLQVADGVAWAVSRIADRDEVNANLGDGGGVSGFLRNIIGVNISILFVEASQEQIRLSMRSKKGYDVGQLALTLGGGGHTQAAGATLQMRLHDAVSMVIEHAKAIQPN